MVIYRTRVARRIAQNTWSIEWLASLGASRKTLVSQAPNSRNKRTASETAEAGLTWPKTTAPMGGGHMLSFNVLGQTVSESIGK